jgi:hypothetical protein
MRYEPAFVEAFIAQCRTSAPSLPTRKPGASKRMLVEAVRPQIDQWRNEGHTLKAIAQRFSELGVPMSVNTLRTCLRRSESPARPRRRARARRPKRDSSRAQTWVSSAAPPDIVLREDAAVPIEPAAARSSEIAGSRGRESLHPNTRTPVSAAQDAASRGPKDVLPQDPATTPAWKNALKDASSPNTKSTAAPVGTGWVPRNR